MKGGTIRGSHILGSSWSINVPDIAAVSFHDCTLSQWFKADNDSAFWYPHSVQEGCVASTSEYKQTNSMVWVRERTIPTERPPLVGEVIANFWG
jgi:hypothetical protein